MAKKRRTTFDPKAFLAKVGDGRSVKKYRKSEIVFSQGDAADAVFYVQKGKVKVTVVSKQGKEAVLAILGTDDFFGEGCLAGQQTRITSAMTLIESTVSRLEKTAIIDAIHREPAFSELFIAHLLSRTIRIEADLVDQLFNSSEKRLARLLLLLANFGKEGQAGADHRQDQPRDAGRNDRDHTIARQLFHEQVPQTRLHRLQRTHRGSQLSA